jgi:glycosyltransferase involved in cell wall biosynthesis
MVGNCTLVIPAHNEADRIANLLTAFDSWERESIVVVDNGSNDETASVAAKFGVVVLEEPRLGKGYAVARGVTWARTDDVFLCDADVSGITEAAFIELLATRHDEEVLARLSIRRPADRAPVTLLTAMPLLAALGLDDQIAEPIGGLALVSRAFITRQHLHGGWGFDIGLTIASLRCSDRIREVEVVGVTHRSKCLAEYEQMAKDVLRAGLQAAEVLPWSHADCVRCNKPADAWREDVNRASGQPGHRSPRPKPH